MEKSADRDAQLDAKSKIGLALLSQEERQSLDEFIIFLARVVARVIEKEAANRRTTWEIWDDKVIARTKPLVVKPDQKLALSLEEASKLLGISRSLAYRAAKLGKIPSLTIGRRILIPRIGLYKILENIGGKNPSDKK